MRKRVLSLLLTIVMLLGMLPGTALAWTGTEDYVIVTAEKYDAAGNGTFLLEPMRISKVSAGDMAEWISQAYGSSNVKMEEDDWGPRDITGYVDATQTDGWLDNGDLGESSKWLVWLRATNQYGEDRKYTIPVDYRKISALDMVRLVFVADGAQIDMDTVKKDDLLILTSGMNDDQIDAAGVAYQGALDMLLKKNATQDEVDKAYAALERALLPSNPAVGIQVSPNPVKVSVGKTKDLTATLLTVEGNESTDTVTWEIANTSIATVSAEGTAAAVTGVAEGETTLTVRANETIFLTVPVKVGDIPATGITLPETASVEEMNTTRLIPTLTPADSTDIVTWSVADSTIATVDQEGLVRGLTAGVTTVTATANGHSDTCTLTVTAAPYVYFEYSDGTKKLPEDGSFTLTSLDVGKFVVANRSGAVWSCNGNVPDPNPEYPDAVRTHYWINSETGVWTPSGTQPTTATVSAGGFSDSFTINYQTASGITELKTLVNGVEANMETPFSMDGTGKADIVTQGLLNGEWITVPQQALKYTTSDTTYNIRILGNELILGMEGGATLTATMIGESVSASFQAQCGSVPLTGFTIATPETFTITGEKNFMNDQYYGLELYSQNLVITYEPSNTTQTELEWECLTPDIAFYTTEHLAGIVPLRCGTAQFKVTSKSNSELTQTVTVKFLYQNPLISASLAKTAYTLEVGQNEALNFTFTPENATDKGFTYSYDKAGIVEVKDGKIFAQAVGQVTVTATPSDQTMDCQPVTFTVTVNRDSSTPYENVKLNVGESKTYIDNTGDYTGASLEGLNTDVATVTLEAETSDPIVIGNLGNDSSFNSATVDISKCLYNFKKNDDGTWTITGTDASGNTVYLYPGNGKDVANGDRTAGYPNAAADNSQLDGMTITISQGNDDGSFYIWSNENAWQNEYGGYLYFNRMDYNWNRSQTITSDTDRSYCSMFLYRAAADDETSSEAIPGYVRVTSVDALTDGQYLIAAPGGDGNWYVAYPSASTASLYAQIARVSSSSAASTKITITGVAAGETSVTVNGVAYEITVVEADRTLTSDWPSFRGNDYNNGVTSYRTPRNAAETAQKWVNQISTGWPDTPSPMILVDGDLVIMSGSTLYKLSTATGAKVDSATMAAAPSYATTPPLFADNMIFCQLDGGKVQAFNADTLESLWVYTDENGGQAQSPIAYSDGKLYVGFNYNDNGTGNCSFVCLNAEDGTLVWRDVDGYGYYWDGAVVVGDYVIYGTNGGKVVSRNKADGEVVTTLDVGNKVRSSICYEAGKIYFADYAANLCYADLNTATGALSNLTKVDCSVYGSYSTSTPVVYKGIAYFGVGGWSGNKSIVAVDVETNAIKWAIEEPAYPQCSILLSTAYEATDGYIYLYVTYNNNPGGVNVIKAKADGSEAAQETLYTPASDYQQYCICSVIADSDGTLYYKNDSGAIFALGKAENAADVAAAAAVIASINGIGTVTLGSETAITAARAAYNALTDDQKALVTNYSVLVAAEAALAHLKNPGTTPDPEDDKITVTFRLIGAEKATQDVDMKNSDYVPEYVTWIKTTTYKVDEDAKVYDVFMKALDKAGLDQSGAENNYVRWITAPASLGGYRLGEFTNGQYSGWMYTINGQHGDYGLKEQGLEDGDEIVWHYVNDYRYEIKDWYGGSDGDESTWNKWLDAKDVNPASSGSGAGGAGGGAVSAADQNAADKVADLITNIGTVTKDSGSKIEAARKAYDALTDAQKELVSNYSRLTAAEAEYAKLTDKLLFTDVKEGDYCYDAVKWAVEQGITNGTTATTFSPNVGCTRAQMVTFLWRAAGSPEPAGKTNPFTDVKEDDYYFKALLWAMENGITKGTTETTFSPNAACTRGQMAAFLYRSAKSPAVEGENPFADVQESDYFFGAVLWAAEEGVTKGTTETTFSPAATCTRGQMVTFLYRYLAK